MIKLRIEASGALNLPWYLGRGAAVRGFGIEVAWRDYPAAPGDGEGPATAS
jgi:hypothetical protein